MKKEALVSVKVKKKTIKYEQLKTLTKELLNAGVVDGEIIEGYKLNNIEGYLTMPGRLVKIYRVGERVFLFCDDEYVYEYLDGKTNRIYDTNSQDAPMIQEILSAGEKKILIVKKDGTGATVDSLGATQDVSGLAFGEFSTRYNGMLVSAQGSCLNFSATLNMLNFSTGLNGGKQMRFASSLGEVCGLVVYGDKLLVFFQHGVVSVYSFGGTMDFKVEEVTLPELSIAKGSVKKIGDKVYFLSRNKLYCLKNKNLEVVESVCALTRCIPIGNAVTMDTEYLLPVSLDYADGYYVYSYNTIDGVERLTKLYSKNISDGGYVENTSSYKLARLSDVGSVYGMRVWESEAENFNSYEKKTLTDIQVYSNAQCSLTVKGDFGSKTYLLKQGLNKKRINLDSETFTFRIDGSSTGINVKDITLRYTEKGGNINAI